MSHKIKRNIFNFFFSMYVPEDAFCNTTLNSTIHCFSESVGITRGDAYRLFVVSLYFTMLYIDLTSNKK